MSAAAKEFHMQVCKKLIDRIRSMCDLSYKILKYTLIISCFMLAASAAILIFGNTYSSFYLAKELYTLPAALMLVGIIISACAEDMSSK